MVVEDQGSTFGVRERRRQLSAEFKRKPVQMMTTLSGTTIRRVAKDLGIKNDCSVDGGVLDAAAQ